MPLFDPHGLCQFSGSVAEVSDEFGFSASLHKLDAFRWLQRPNENGFRDLRTVRDYIHTQMLAVDHIKIHKSAFAELHGGSCGTAGPVRMSRSVIVPHIGFHLYNDPFCGAFRSMVYQLFPDEVMGNIQTGAEIEFTC